MSEFTVVQIGEEFAVAAYDQPVISFESVEPAIELAQALAGQVTVVELTTGK